MLPVAGFYLNARRLKAGLKTFGNFPHIRLDGILYKTERTVTWREGLPRRGYLKHQICVPGFYIGCVVKTLPAVCKTIEQRNWKEAK